MSTNTIHAPLDFMPAQKDTRRPRGWMDSVRTFFSAIRRGLEASHQYESLIAQGMAPQKAIDIVFREKFADRR